MEKQATAELMNRLFSEIEQGWRDQGDRLLVYRLAEKHPELRSELYEFFEDLVLGDGNDISSEVAAAEDRVTRWIQTSGLDIATAAAKRERLQPTTTKPTRRSDVSGITEPAAHQQQKAMGIEETWLAFLRQRIRQPLPEIANALPNVNVEYLVLISRHPDKVPLGVCRMLATSVEKQWRVPADESLRCLSTHHVVVRAASRSRPFSAEPATFQDLLDRAALTQEQKNFWMQCVEVE